MLGTQYEDIRINCSCGTMFIWTIGEQRYMQKLLDQGSIQRIIQPMRCPECRAKKKAAMARVSAVRDDITNGI